MRLIRPLFLLLTLLSYLSQAGAVVVSSQGHVHGQGHAMPAEQPMQHAHPPHQAHGQAQDQVHDGAGASMHQHHTPTTSDTSHLSSASKSSSENCCPQQCDCPVGGCVFSALVAGSALAFSQHLTPQLLSSSTLYLDAPAHTKLRPPISA